MRCACYSGIVGEGQGLFWHVFGSRMMLKLAHIVCVCNVCVCIISTYNISHNYCRTLNEYIYSIYLVLLLYPEDLWYWRLCLDFMVFNHHVREYYDWILNEWAMSVLYRKVIRITAFQTYLSIIMQKFNRMAGHYYLTHMILCVFYIRITFQDFGSKTDITTSTIEYDE